MIFKFLKVLSSFCLVVFLFTGCKPVDIEKEIKISIDLNIFKTFISFRFADAETGELIGKTNGTTVNLVIGGRDADAVVSQTGEHENPHQSVLGMISVALDPYGKYKMVPGNSVVFNFTASAPGYAPTQASITISKTGTQVCMVCMRKTGYSDNKPQFYQIKPGEIIGGLLPAGFRMITPANHFELDFGDSTLFTGPSGEQASGALNVKTTRYNRISETDAGSSRIMNFLIDGNITPGTLNAAGILSLTLQSATPGTLTQLPGKPINWRFPVNSDFSSGDSIPVWRFDAVEKLWKSAGYAEIITEDTTRFATVPLHLTGLFASGTMMPARLVTGEISISIDKPFLAPSFPGNILLTDAATGERIQLIPVTLFSGLSMPLKIYVPAESTVTLSLQAADADYEFISLPASLTILPDQSDFSGSFTLVPLKCRLSGTVIAAFPADFNAYPIPGTLQVLDAASGSALLSISISITSAQFSTDISLMVRDNRPVTIRVIPSTLAGDFLATPTFIREDSPCLENGFWKFALDASTCLAQTTAYITLSGTPPREPVPAEMQLLRASDRRLIKKMAVSLAQTTTAIDIQSTVPKNTSVLIVVRPAATNRPFTSDPAEFLWDNPCTTPVKPTFRITPGYAQLMGMIRFTFSPGLIPDEIPIRILTYTRQGDRLLTSQDYLVKRSDPVIRINQFTPAEPLYFKISRAVSSALVSPIPFKIDIPDPADTPEFWPVTLNPTVLLPVHFLVKVVCPKGEVLPTVQGYYRIPGDDWHEMNIVSGSLTIQIELGLTYEVGMILGGVMIDSIFLVEKQENDLTFPLEPADCEKMGWGGN